MGRRTVKALQDALRDVERDVEAAERRTEQLKSYAQELRRMIAFYASIEEGGEASARELAAREAAPRLTRTPPQESKVARNAIYGILREEGEPMHYREVLDALRTQGIVIEGKDPGNNVRSHLSHDTRFLPVGGGKWDLASRANGSHDSASSVRPKVGTDGPTMPAAPTKVAAAPEEEPETAGDEPPPLSDDWIMPEDLDDAMPDEAEMEEATAAFLCRLSLEVA